MANETPAYLNIHLTDIQTHVIHHRKPESFARKILKIFHHSNKNGGRVYGGKISRPKEGEPLFAIDLFKQFGPAIEEAKRKGMGIRITIPENGLPINSGPDVVEYLEAKKKKLFKK